VALEPRDREAYVALIETNQVLGKTDQALAWAKTAANRNPGIAWPEIMVGDVYSSQGQAGNAWEAYQRAVANEPGSVEALIAVGWAGLVRGKYAEAMAAYDQAIKLQPGNADAHLAMASAYSAQSRIEEALAEYERAVETNLSSPDPYVALGDFYKIRGELDAAIAAYRQALDVDVYNVSAMVAVGDVMHAQGRTSEAAEQYLRAADTNPGLSSPQLALGSLWSEMQEHGQAEGAYRRAIAAQPGDVRSYINLALTQQMTGQPDEALQWCDLALTIDPGSALAYSTKAGILTKEYGDFDTALSLYERAVRLDPRQTQAYDNSGRIHLREKGDLDSFISELEALGTAQPGEAWIQGMLAYAYKAEVATADAIDSFESLLRLVPDYADGHCDLARLYEGILEREPAMEHWGMCATLARDTDLYTDAAAHRDQLDHTVITSPSDGDTVSGLLEIRGSARIDQFQYYKVELGIGEEPTTWSVIGDISAVPVVDGVLATLDTGRLPEGTYTLRLTVVDNTGNLTPPHRVRIILRR
jgi:tetratricopeptide (TPR) repeat protein